jgi:hypothetical protein
MNIAMGSVLPDVAREAAFQYLDEFDRTTYGRGDKYFTLPALSGLWQRESWEENCAPTKPRPPKRSSIPGLHRRRLAFL